MLMIRIGSDPGSVEYGFVVAIDDVEYPPLRDTTPSVFCKCSPHFHTRTISATTRSPNDGLRFLIVLAAVAILSFLVIQQRYTPSCPAKSQLQVSEPLGRTSTKLIQRIAIPFGNDTSYRFSHKINLADPHVKTKVDQRLVAPFADTYDERAYNLSYSHAKRADPVDFDYYVCKGANYLKEIKTAPADPARFSYADLPRNGWVLSRDKPFNLPQAVLDAMKAKNIPTTEDANPRVKADLLNHFDNYLGQRTPSDGGSFLEIYNVAGGALIAIDNTSPAYCANLDPVTFQPVANPKTGLALKAVIPVLNSWTDVFWAIWVETAGPVNAANLQYIIRVNVVNPITKAIIEKVNGIQGDKVTDMLDLPWPGRTFSTNKDNGKALLGTPHGVGTTWLSVMGRGTLGPRAAPACTVFTERNASGKFTYFLLWDLGTLGL
ncbi:MAG: hypothetical protein Q9218_002764 [Villophora microphyllina]